MKKKIVGIFVCMLLIVVVLPVMGFEERNAVNPIGNLSTKTNDDTVEIGGIRGGMRVSIAVKNIGNFIIDEIEWNIRTEGLIFAGSTSGTIEDFYPNQQIILHSRVIVGIGPGLLVVYVGDKNKDVNCFVFGMMTYVFPN